MKIKSKIFVRALPENNLMIFFTNKYIMYILYYIFLLYIYKILAEKMCVYKLIHTHIYIILLIILLICTLTNYLFYFINYQSFFVCK